MAKIFAVCLGVLLLSGCFEAIETTTGKISASSASKAGAATEPDVSFDEGSSKASAVIDISSAQDTVVSAPTQSALVGSSITLSPGSLDIATSLVLELGLPLGDTSVSQEVSVPADMQIQNSGPGIIIRPTEPVNLKNPLAISLPLPTATGLRLVASSYAIFFKYIEPDTQKLISGLIPADGKLASIEFDEKAGRDLVRFNGYFGAYWVVQISRPFLSAEVPPKVESKEPIVNSLNTSVMASGGIVKESEIVATQALPSYELSLPLLSFDAASRKATASVKAENHFKACRVDFFEKVTDAKGLSFETGNLFAWTLNVEKTSEHTLTARFRCTDINGKSVVSKWSTVSVIPALPAVVAPIPEPSPTPTPTPTPISAPVFIALSPAGVAADGFINNAEKLLVDSLWTLNASGYTSIRYTSPILDASGSIVCDGTQTYSSTAIPSPSNLSKEGAHILCAELKNESPDPVYGKSLPIIRDTISPVLSGMAFANEAADALIDTAEKDSTLPLYTFAGNGYSQLEFSSMLNDAGSVLICDSSVSYSSPTIPAAASMTTDGAYALCARAKDPAQNVAYLKSPSLVRTAPPIPTFQTVWKTDNAGITDTFSIKLPLSNSGTYNFTVQWGDGSWNTITSWDSPLATHTYAAPGTYTVSIQGMIVGWSFGGTGDREKILEVKSWGPLQLGSSVGAFEKAHNLTVTATDILDLSGATSLDRMFAECYVLTQVPNIGSWDTSGILSMESVFAHAYVFNGAIGSWNTQNVTSMRNMFLFAQAFNQNLNTWDVGFVTDMFAMFHGASSFNQSLSNWNVSSVSDFGSMFQGASAFNQPIGSWDVLGATVMTQMFEGAAQFSQDLSTWEVQNVYYMNSMFKDAAAFNGDISTWNVASLLNMESMFMGASSFNQNIGSWNTTSVFSMERAFQFATQFNQYIGLWPTLNVSNMAHMFEGASSFDQDISDWDVGQVTNMTSMFRGATAFNSPLAGWNISSVVNMDSMFLEASAFNQPLNTWDMSSVTNTSSMFRDAVNFNQTLSTWNVSLVTNFEFMFAGALAYGQSIASWTPIAATSMAGMFQGTTQPTANYDDLLVAWGALSLPPAVSFDAGFTSYSAGSAADARAILVGLGWAILDMGEAP